MALSPVVGLADDGQRLLRIDHYVPVRSIPPWMSGQIYLREVVQSGVALRAGAVRPPVFITARGAVRQHNGTHHDGRIGLARHRRDGGSDPRDAWGPRWTPRGRLCRTASGESGAYCAAGSGLLRSVADAPRRQPPPLPMLRRSTPNRAHLDANWDRQLGCPDQFDMAAREAVRADMLASDPVGASWGTGVRRAPNVGGSARGWNPEVVGKMRTPALFIAAVHDKQALPERIRALHTDYGAAENRCRWSGSPREP